MNKSDELQIAINAAKIGTQVGLKYFDKKIDVSHKSDNTLVTHADMEAEEEIKKFILTQDTDAKFLAEESGGNMDEKRLWIIDPIDGTRCYVRGIPFWCTLVSLLEDGKVKLTVCYFPLMPDGLLFGEVGKGAYCGEQRVHVSNVSNLQEAYMTFGSIKHFTDKSQLLNVIDHVDGIRGYEPTYGSALLVRGKVDVGVDVFAQPWDSAPFKVMLEEAGGKITMTDGTPWNIHGRGFIATNGILHDEVVRLYNSPVS